MKAHVGLLLFLAAVSLCADDHLARGQDTNLLEIQSMSIDDRVISNGLVGTVRLGAFPKDVRFTYGAGANANRLLNRLRYKLDGYDTNWDGISGQMRLSISFCDEAEKKIRQDDFKVGGDSLGWNGSLENSTLTHRRSTLVVPPHASRLWVTISSAGPPACVGLYVVKDLAVTRLPAGGGKPNVLLQSEDAIDETASNWIRTAAPPIWIRDGTSPSMARVVELGQYSKAKALAILDDDPTGHAEWHNDYAQSPEVGPGDSIIIEWDELYTMGTGETATTHDYRILPPGKFRLRVSEVTALGDPTGVEASLEIVVLPPVWQRPFFWVLATLCAITVIVSASRYYTWRKMRHELARVERLRELEQERLRIARDIHDDLGARATQISILSSMSPNNPAFPANARSDLNRIFDLSRELIMALYQTIWAVNPENDNLYALGNYIRQMADHLCGPAQLRYRLHVEDLPRQVQVSSQVRHNIMMAVKESIHNVVKHAKASEITIRVTFDGKTLRIVVQDDGCGFELASAVIHNGLANMKHRLQDIGGACVVESRPGHGTIISLQLELQPISEDSSHAHAAHDGNANDAQIKHE